MTKPKRTRPDPKRVHVSPTIGSPVRHIIAMDMEPLLQAERARCEKAARKLDGAKEQLEHFQEICEPAFSRWFHCKDSVAPVRRGDKFMGFLSSRREQSHERKSTS